MKIIELLNDYYGTESKNMDEFEKNVYEDIDDLEFPKHIVNFLRFLERKGE